MKLKQYSQQGIIKIFILIFFLILNSQVYADNIYQTYSVTPNVGDEKQGEFPVPKVDREKGYYVDGRGQVPEYNRIAPPNEDKIPTTSHPTRTVEDFESYYDRNIKGLRRQDYMIPIIPNYNRFYSNRVAQPYTKQEYLDVWCAGQIDYTAGSCITQDYVTYFHPVRNWAGAVTSIPFRAKRVKGLGKKIAFFLWVNDLAGDTPYLHDARDFANTFNIKIFFGTIDSAIPESWLGL